MPRGVTTPSYTEVSVGTTTQVGQAWQGIVNLLESVGWVVTSSGDGLSSYNSSGKDFTNTTAGAAHSYQNANAWFVIRAPAAVDGNTRRLCVQIIALSNTGSCRIKYTANAAFSGGSPSATQTPTATGEFVARGGGTDAAPTGERMWSDQTAGTNVLVGVADAAAPYGFMFSHRRIGSTTDIEEARFGMDPVLTPAGVTRSADTDKVVIHCGAANGAWMAAGISTVTKLAGTNDPPYGADSTGTLRAFCLETYGAAGGTVNLASIPDESTTASTGFITDPWSTKVNLFPLIYANETYGIKGVSSLLMAHDMDVTTAVADRQTLLNGDGQTKSYMKLMGFVMPWNGSDPSNGSWSNTDAELWDISTDRTAPIVSGWTPALASTLAATATVQFDVTDAANRLARIVVWANYGSGQPDELVHDGLTSGFSALFTHASNANTSITNGRRLVIRKDTDGWPTAALTLKVIAFDYNGNILASTSNSYTTTPAPTLPVIAAYSPAPGAISNTGSITIDVTHANSLLQRIIVTTVRGDGVEEVIHDGLTSGFTGNFDGASTNTVIATGRRLVVTPDVAWNQASFNIHVRAIDSKAQEATRTGAYTTTYALSAPVIATYSPAPGSISNTGSIQIDVTDADADLQRIIVHVERADGIDELIHDGLTSGFTANFNGTSTNTSITNGRRLVIVPDLNWNQASFTVKVRAIDATARETTASGAYTTSYALSAPTIATYSPAPGLISKTQAITIDVTDADTDLQRILVYADMDDGTTELIHDGLTSGFKAPYSASSTNGSISGGRRLVVTRTGGWEDNAFTLRVRAIDATARETTAAGAYTTDYTQSDPVITAVTAEGAIAYVDPIELEVTDDDNDVVRIRVTATYGADHVAGAITESVYDGAAFESAFITDSTTDGETFLLSRTGGWPSADVLITVEATDSRGEITTEEFVYTTNFEPIPEDTGPPTIENLTPADGQIRRYTVITFDVLDDQPLVFTGLVAEYDDAEDDIVFDGFEFGKHYQTSVNQRTAIAGGYHFKVRRDDGWLNTPNFKPAMIDGAGNIGDIA